MSYRNTLPNRNYDGFTVKTKLILSSDFIDYAVFLAQSISDPSIYSRDPGFESPDNITRIFETIARDGGLQIRFPLLAEIAQNPDLIRSAETMSNSLTGPPTDGLTSFLQNSVRPRIETVGLFPEHIPIVLALAYGTWIAFNNVAVQPYQNHVITEIIAGRPPGVYRGLDFTPNIPTNTLDTVILNNFLKSAGFFNWITTGLVPPPPVFTPAPALPAVITIPPPRIGGPKIDYKVFDTAQRFTASVIATILFELFENPVAADNFEEDFGRRLMDTSRRLKFASYELLTTNSFDFCTSLRIPSGSNRGEQINIESTGPVGGTAQKIGNLGFKKVDSLGNIVSGLIEQLDVNISSTGMLPVSVKIIGKGANTEQRNFSGLNFITVQRAVQTTDFPDPDRAFNTVITNIPYGRIQEEERVRTLANNYIYDIRGIDPVSGVYEWAKIANPEAFAYNAGTDSYVPTPPPFNRDSIFKRWWAPVFNINPNIITIDLGDPNHEVFVTTLIGNYYDEGQLPFVNKFYGYFRCSDDPATPQYLITSKATGDVRSILRSVSCSPSGSPVANPKSIDKWTTNAGVVLTPRDNKNLLLGIIAQVAYSLHFLKEKLSLSHYDLHSGNVMYSYVSNRMINIPGTEVIPTVYQGKKLENVKWFEILMPSGEKLMVQNTGILLKIIDFGMCSIDLKSGNNVVQMCHNSSLYRGDDAKRIVDTNQSAFNSMEMMYFLVTILEEYFSIASFDISDPVIDMIGSLLAGLEDHQFPGTSIIQLIVDNLVTYDVVYPQTRFNARTGRNEVIDSTGKGVPIFGGQSLDCFKSFPKGRTREFFGLAYPDASRPGGAQARRLVKRRDILDTVRVPQFTHWWDKIKALAIPHDITMPGASGIDTRVYCITVDGSLPSSCTTNRGGKLVVPNDVIILGGLGNQVSTPVGQVSGTFVQFTKAAESYMESCTSNPQPPIDQAYLNMVGKIRGMSGLPKTNSSGSPMSADDLTAKYGNVGNLCSIVKNKHIIPNSPNRLLKKMITGENPLYLYDLANRTIDSATLRNTLTGVGPGLAVQKAVGNMTAFTLSVTPNIPSLASISPGSPLNLVKYPYQKWTNFSTPENVGDYIDAVRIHVTKIANPGGQGPNGSIKIKSSLWDAAQEREQMNPGSSAFYTNGGYFIVDPNIKDSLRPYDITSFQGLPIGYTYFVGNDEGNGFIFLDLPYFYKKDMGTVVFYNDGRIVIENTLDFENRHITDDRPAKIQRVSDSQILTGTAQSIKLFKDSLAAGQTTVQGTPKYKDGGEVDYNYAFTTGPILVKDGRIVFTKEKMLNSQFVFENSGAPAMVEATPTYPGPGDYPTDKQFRVTSFAKTNSAYSAGPPEDRSFPWGQRHSNFFINHNVMATLDDGSVVFFLVEGRGFESPGLDRSQLAEIISLFGVKTAVSLDGGFSAQGVIKEGAESYFLVNDPDKRQVGIVMEFLI